MDHDEITDIERAKSNEPRYLKQFVSCMELNVRESVTLTTRNRIVEGSFWKRKKTCFCGSNRESCTSCGKGQSTSNVQASTNVAEALDLPRSTVQKIMRSILLYHPYKLQLVQELLPHDFETRHLFSLQFLARLEVDSELPWNIL
ncbi:uncharacterized protein TNCV_4214391 [Trichonephila clavipes]|nr:uncharacterized protein TNCV_4214391 [Trichonephila clavipes]